LIIVDQNDDDRVFKIYEQYKEKLDFKYLKCGRRGISIGRNTGLEHITGDIIAFPDDDCEYETDTLEKVIVFLNENQDYGFYTCNTKEKYGSNSVLKTQKKDCNIRIGNFLSAAVSITIFVRSEAFTGFLFDEQLGVGAAFGSGEESDLLLYLIKNKKKGRYHAAHFIYHPGKTENTQRVYSYSLGYGALFKKAMFVYHFYIMFFIFLYRITRNIIKLCLHPSDKNIRSLIRGRLGGFFKYKPLVKIN
jgi:glycosyltransferase involved in cell wall biosynthesis